MASALLLGPWSVACGADTQVTTDPHGVHLPSQSPGRPTSQAPGQSTVDGSPGFAVSVLTVGPDTGGPQPYAWINGPYVVRTGRTIEIDGSGSYARAGSLETYEWDFDSDGTVDLTSASPVVEHTFTTRYEGLLTLRVTDATGHRAVATTHLAVSDDGDETPTDEDNCPHANNPGQEDYDQDGVGDQCDPTPGWPAEDASGVTESTD